MQYTHLGRTGLQVDRIWPGPGEAPEAYAW